MTYYSLQVEFVESNDSIDWYEIRSQAQDAWPSVIKGSTLDGSADSEMQITMVSPEKFIINTNYRIFRVGSPDLWNAMRTESDESLRRWLPPPIRLTAIMDPSQWFVVTSPLSGRLQLMLNQKKLPLFPPLRPIPVQLLLRHQHYLPTQLHVGNVSFK